MRTLGLDPIEVLVLPRMFGADDRRCRCSPSTPTSMGILGGALMCVAVARHPAAAVPHRAAQCAIDDLDLLGRHHQGAGLRLRSSRWSAASRGCNVARSAESVGRLTTQSVVRIDLPGDRHRRRSSRSSSRGSRSEHADRQAGVDHPGPRPVNRFGAAGAARRSRPRRHPRRGAGRGRRLGHRQVGAAAHDRRPQAAGGGHDRGVRQRSCGHAATREHERIEARWGVLFQDGALFSSLTVAENIEVPLREHTRPAARADGRDRGAARSRWSGCRPMPGRNIPPQLSGGMRKRAGLARALALDPESCSSTSRPPASTRSRAADFDQLIRDLQAEPRPHRLHGDARSRQPRCDRRPHRGAGRQAMRVGTIEECCRTSIRGFTRISAARAAARRSAPWRARRAGPHGNPRQLRHRRQRSSSSSSPPS